MSPEMEDGGSLSPSPTRAASSASKLKLELKLAGNRFMDKFFKEVIQHFKELKATGKKFQDEELALFIFMLPHIKDEYQPEIEKLLKMTHELEEAGELDPSEYMYKMSPEMEEEFRNVTSALTVSGRPLDPHDGKSSSLSPSPTRAASSGSKLKLQTTQFNHRGYADMTGSGRPLRSPGSGSRSPQPTRGTAASSKRKLDLKQKVQHLHDIVFEEAIKDFNSMKASARKMTTEQLQLHILTITTKVFDSPEGDKINKLGAELMMAGEWGPEDAKFNLNPEMFEKFTKAVSAICDMGFVEEKWKALGIGGSGSRSPRPTRSAAAASSRRKSDLKQKVQQLHDIVFEEAIKDFNSMKASARKMTTEQLQLHILTIMTKVFDSPEGAKINKMGAELMMAGEWGPEDAKFNLNPEMFDQFTKAVSAICDLGYVQEKWKALGIEGSGSLSPRSTIGVRL